LSCLGKHVVGISFQGQSQAQSIGYIVPVSVIQHVLDDIELHNKYTAFPIMTFYYQPMENTSYREYLKLDEDQHGILVTSVEQACVLSKVLKEDDVITAINNVPIADDGTIYFRRGERLNFRYLEKLQFVDDTVTFTIIRQGKRDRKCTFTRTYVVMTLRRILHVTIRKAI
jgi:S1-C subfamily serine protease